MASNKRFSFAPKDYLVVFLVAGFFAVVFLATGFLVAGFVAGLLADFSVLTPADFAILTKLALRREAVFFLMRPFLAALSYSL